MYMSIDSVLSSRLFAKLGKISEFCESEVFTLFVCSQQLLNLWRHEKAKLGSEKFE